MLGQAETPFFQKALDGLVKFQPALPKDVAELKDILAKFTETTTKNQITVALAVSIRSEIDDFLLGKPQLAAEFAALVRPFGDLPGPVNGLPFRSFIKLVRITASLETQDPRTVHLTLFQLDTGFGIKIDDPKGESLVSLQPTSAGEATATNNLDLDSLLDSPLDTSANSPLRKVGFIEKAFFQNVLDGQTPVQTPLSPKDLAELGDIIGKFTYLTTIHDTITVQFAVSIRSEIDDFFLGRPQLAAKLGALIGKIPISAEFVKPLDQFLPSDVGSAVPFGTFLELLRIGASLESGQTLLVSTADFDFGGIDESSGQTLIFLQRADTPGAFELQAVTSSAPADGSKDQLRDEFFESVSSAIGESGLGAGSGGAELSLVSGSSNPAPSALVAIPRSESGWAEGNSDLPVAVLVGNPLQEPPIVRPSAPLRERPPLPELGPAPPVSAETPLNNFIGGFGEALRRSPLVPEAGRRRATVPVGASDRPRPPVPSIVPAPSGPRKESPSPLPGSLDALLQDFPAWSAIARNCFGCMTGDKSDDAMLGWDGFCSDPELVQGLAEPALAALLAAGVCHASWPERARRRRKSTLT
jgi:hypothetical protein